ncbi:MAG: GH32 C-terminal domain-containing protein [Muribaculaceae bacterium]|nr:GH32 C-terminal domain-containing protein [Muribaculaceae bacterium]
MNSFLKKGLTLMAASAATFAGMAQDIKVEHLSPNHTFVRLTGNDKLLLLPIQESVEDARINVIVDGKTERTFYARLTKNKTDFQVPFDLSPYAGKNVILEVLSHHDRSSQREAKDDSAWSEITLADSFDTTNREKFRPMFHHTPEYGWMNDPNGMFYKDGVWHLYYQWNPYGSKWQNMTWGHSTSKDLVNWEHHPAAILPNGLGTVFSGSAAIDTENSAGFGENAVVAMYTSAGDSQTQSLAVSHDNGETFEIYPGNPVIALDSEARDPNFFWNSETKLWTLILAHALDHEMLIFTSPDMKEWTLQSSFGKGLGAQDGVWECPDLMELTAADGSKKWVLICNLNPGGPFGGSGIQYFTGDFDGKKFTVDKDLNGNVSTKWLDFGKDNYALVSWSDAPGDERPVIGWMSNWQYAADVPTMQYRSANTLPSAMTLFKGTDGQYYASLYPVKEIDSARGALAVNVKKTSVSKSPKKFNLPAANNGICEIALTIDPKKNSDVTLTLSNSKGEEVAMTYDVETSTFSFNREKSGIVDFSRDFPAITTAPTFGTSDRLSLRIFVDTSSIEVFGNDGRFAMTNLVFPNEPYSSLSISAEKGNAEISNLKIYSLNPQK